MPAQQVTVAVLVIVVIVRTLWVEKKCLLTGCVDVVVVVISVEAILLTT